MLAESQAESQAESTSNPGAASINGPGKTSKIGKARYTGSDAGRAARQTMLTLVCCGVLVGCGGGGSGGSGGSSNSASTSPSSDSAVGAAPGAAPVDASPVGATPTDGTPTKDTPTEGTPTEGTVAEETPAQETPSQETPKEGAPAEALPADALLTDRLFGASSFWYTAIALDAPLHANSAGFVADFLRQKNSYYQTVNINTRDYASPLFIAAADTPAVRVAYWNCQNKSYPETALQAQWEAVPMPSAAVPADGTDAELTVYQPATDTLWEFWVTRHDDGQWRACWGGRMNNVSTDDGIWSRPYGTTATGLPFLGGQITAEELERGEIRHAIGISLVEAEHFSVVSWPANRSDGWNPGREPNRIPQGLRFRLDPTIDVELLPMSRAGKTIAKAAQTYGFVVWDKAGALSIRAQNPKSYTALGQPDPYPALFGNRPSYAVLDGFPWERLQFLPLDYGKR